MIICNVNIESIEKEMEFGTLHQIVLGEYGRGRRELRLTCPPKTVLKRGCNFGLTITQTKSGKPRISKTDVDNEIYLLISTKGRYTRRGDGWVGSWHQNKCKYTCLAKGNGADGDAGRIGSWDVVLVKVDGATPCDWIRIRTGGGGYGIDPQWLAITDKGYFLFDKTDNAIDFADAMSYDFPPLDDDVTETFARIS